MVQKAIKELERIASLPPLPLTLMTRDTDLHMPELPEWMKDRRRIEQTKYESKLQTHPEQLKAFENITVLIDEVRRCWTAEDYRTVQQHLGKHIEYADAAVGDANKAQGRAEKQLGRFRLKNMPPASKEVSQAQADLEQAELNRELYLRLGRQYRTVDDAIAWQFYGFQALPIFALGMNTSPGINSRSKQVGADAEVDAIEKLWREKRVFALRHDYTNCLRVWDLSVLNPDHPDTPEILEIKAKGRRVSSQQKRKGKVAIELKSHQATTRPDGTVLVHQRYTRQTSTGSQETTLDLLRRALLSARTEGVGTASNSYLAVKAVDMAFEGSLNQIINVWQKWEDIPPEIETPDCTEYLIDNSYPRKPEADFRAPYSIYPLPVRDASGLITGYLRVRTYLNTAVLTRAFQLAGFETECLLEQYHKEGLYGSELNANVDCYRLKRGGINILISGLPLGQILFEGLPLGSYWARVLKCWPM